VLRRVEGVWLTRHAFVKSRMRREIERNEKIFVVIEEARAGTLGGK
jgi:hypothetical protein